MPRLGQALALARVLGTSVEALWLLADSTATAPDEGT